MGGHKLTSAEHTLMILSMTGTLDSGGPLSLHMRKSVGSVLCKIVYLRRSRPMTLSTWILTLAMPLVFSTSIGSSWVLPLVNAGITNLACFMPTLSAISEFGVSVVNLTIACDWERVGIKIHTYMIC